MLLTLVPLFDENMAVCAYSFFTQRENYLLNPLLLGTAQFDGASQITGLELIQKMGIDTLSQGKEIFVPITNISIFADITEQCDAPHEKIVLLIDNTIPPIEMYVNRLKELKQQGYKLASRKLAVSDFENYREVLKLMDYVLLNNRKIAIDKAKIYFGKLFPNISLCAGNIDTMEDFERLKETGGYRFYEGKFYRVPITKGQTDVAPLKGNYIDLLNIVNSPDFELTTAADIISRDTALTIDLLKMVQPLAVNSEITSIRHAAAMLGQRELKKWINTAVANALYADKLCNYITENGYDTVVMPHLFPAEAMTWLLRQHKLDVQTYFIATDYTCIPFTEETKVDYYFIPHEELATEFIKRGIPAEKLVPTGIPVSERFLKLPEKREARGQLGIPVDKSCILMMTGSMGYGRVESMTAKLVEQIGEDTHLYILGGTNEGLKKTLRDTYADTERVHVLDFTPEAHLYMAAADILFTKPGGLTSTEAVAAKVALVHTKPIPGCEDRNVAFFTQHGMSVSGDTEDAVIQKGLKLLRDPEAQAEMRKCQEKYGKPYAADAVCEFICGQKEAAQEEA